MSSFGNPDTTFFGEAGGQPVRVVSPASSSTVVLRYTERALYVANAATLAALTVMLPKGAAPGAAVWIFFESAITALTIKDGFGVAVPGAPLSAPAGSSMAPRYISKTRGWTPSRALVAADLPPLGDSMAFQAGRFYTANGIISGPASASVATGSLTAGTPIFIPNAVTLQTLSVETSGTVTGTAHARMALYTDAGGLPGAPVASTDTGDLTQTAAGVLTSGVLGGALAPGWYWPVFETSGLAGGTMYAANSARPSMNAQMGNNTAGGAIQNPYRCLFVTHTYGTALPNPWVTSSEGVATFMPVIALGV